MAITVSSATTEPNAGRRKRAHDGQRCILDEWYFDSDGHPRDNAAFGDTRQVQSEEIRLRVSVADDAQLAVDHRRHRTHTHLHSESPGRYHWRLFVLPGAELCVGDLVRQHPRYISKYHRILPKFRNTAGLHLRRHDVFVQPRSDWRDFDGIVRHRFRLHAGIAGLPGASKSYARSN